MYDLSIVIPTIRTHQLPRLWDSLRVACNVYKFELILIGPFTPPQHIIDSPNVMYIKSYDRPSVCAQRAILQANGPAFFYTVDDCDFLPGSIDAAIGLFKQDCGPNDLVNMRYCEGGNSMPLIYWTAGHHDDLRRLAGVNNDWNISLQFIMHQQHFIDMGGFDCAFEYTNCACHDLMFRIQKSGGKIIQSPLEVCNADWMCGSTGDHGPINDCEVLHDMPRLASFYSSENNRAIIDVNNWHEHVGTWVRRFGSGPLPERYEDLYPNASITLARKS